MHSASPHLLDLDRLGCDHRLVLAGVRRCGRAIVRSGVGWALAAELGKAGVDPGEGLHLVGELLLGGLGVASELGLGGGGGIYQCQAPT